MITACISPLQYLLFVSWTQLCKKPLLTVDFLYNKFFNHNQFQSDTRTDQFPSSYLGRIYKFNNQTKYWRGYNTHFLNRWQEIKPSFLKPCDKNNIGFLQVWNAFRGQFLSSFRDYDSSLMKSMRLCEFISPEAHSWI